MKSAALATNIALKEKSFRGFVNQALHNPCTKSSRIINGFIIFLIIFSISVIPLHFFTEPAWIHEPLFLFDRIVVTIFTLEYILRIWSARKPIRYITSWWGIIDLIAILPFYLARFDLFTAPEIFLLLRIFRLLKLGRAYEMERLAIANCAEGSHGEFHVIPGEKIERVVQKHPLVLLANLILPLFLTSAGLLIIVFFPESMLGISIAILFFFFAVVFFIKAWLDYNYDVIYITNQRVIFQNRELFGSITDEVSYESITNVVPNNIGLWHWLFGFGDIKVETPAPGKAGVLTFENAPNPHEVVRHISHNRQLTFQAKASRAELIAKSKEEEIEKLKASQAPDQTLE